MDRLTVASNSGVHRGVGAILPIADVACALCEPLTIDAGNRQRLGEVHEATRGRVARIGGRVGVETGQVGRRNRSRSAAIGIPGVTALRSIVEDIPAGGSRSHRGRTGS